MRYRKARVVMPASARAPDVNVTPMIDVVLVLLIIFMTVAPEQPFVFPEWAAQADSPRLLPPGQPPISIEISHDGVVKLGGQVVADEQFRASLGALLEARVADDQVVLVSADDATPYPLFIAVLGTALDLDAKVLAMPEP